MRTKSASLDENAQKTIDRLTKEKLDAERQRDVYLDRMTDLQRVIDGMKKARVTHFCFTLFFPPFLLFIHLFSSLTV